MGDHRPRLGPAGDPHCRCASQGWDSGWYAYSEDDAGPLSGLEGSGLRIGSQSGSTMMGRAAFYGRSVLLAGGTLDPHPEPASRLSGMTAKIVFPPPGAFSQAPPRAAPPAQARQRRPPASAEVREKKPRALPATGQRKDSGDEAEVQRIVELANQGDCPGVIAAADRYLARQPRSTRQATVLWHQAECYRLMLRSGQ